MDILFKGRYENLKTYESLEDINKYFKEVLNIIEKIEIPTEQQLVEIEKVLWELSDQYWHNYPKKLTGDIKIRLETFIKRHFYYRIICLGVYWVSLFNLYILFQWDYIR